MSIIHQIDNIKFSISYWATYHAIWSSYCMVYIKCMICHIIWVCHIYCMICHIIYMIYDNWLLIYHMKCMIYCMQQYNIWYISYDKLCDILLWYVSCNNKYEPISVTIGVEPAETCKTKTNHVLTRFQPRQAPNAHAHYALNKV